MAFPVRGCTGASRSICRARWPGWPTFRPREPNFAALDGEQGPHAVFWHAGHHPSRRACGLLPMRWAGCDALWVLPPQDLADDGA